MRTQWGLKGHFTSAFCPDWRIRQQTARERKLLSPKSPCHDFLAQVFNSKISRAFCSCIFSICFRMSLIICIRGVICELRTRPCESHRDASFSHINMKGGLIKNLFEPGRAPPMMLMHRQVASPWANSLFFKPRARVPSSALLRSGDSRAPPAAPSFKIHRLAGSWPTQNSLQSYNFE